jgi:hypothetical protein
MFEQEPGAVAVGVGPALEILLTDGTLCSPASYEHGDVAVLELLESAVERVGADRLARFHPLAQVKEHGGRSERGERHLLDMGPSSKW